MASQEAWDFAQLYSANLMHRSGLMLLAVSAVRVFMSGILEVIEVIISLFIVIGSCLYLIVDTENALKAKFGR
ncbi:SdpI family protein [bacterium]|nr:SdpI family protein [bacterium]